MDFSLFLSNTLLAGKQVIILYIIAVVGFVTDRTKLFTESTSRKANDLLFYIITPCVIINSFLNTEFSRDTAIKFAYAGLAATLTFIVAIIITTPFFNKAGVNKPIFKYASIYGNMGYMALPLAQAVLGSEGVFYCSAGVIVFQLFCFTHGVWVMTAEKKEKFNPKTLLFNPGIVAVVIGLPLFLLKVNVPEIISKPISLVGSMQTPLAMLMFGTYISGAGFKGIFNNKNLFLVSFLKLIAVPVIMYFATGVSGLMSGALLSSVIIQAGAPSANNTAMFAAKYDKDTGLASQTVAINSLISIITLPLMIALTQINL